MGRRHAVDALPYGAPPRRPRERVVVLRVKAPDLKAVIIDAYFAGALAAADVDDLFRQYGLEAD